MTTITNEISLSVEDKQILEMPKLFYQYLKEKYGVGKEVTNPVESIFCSIQVNLPGFSKKTEKHSWTIHLEFSGIEANVSKEASSLIIGEHWSKMGTKWERFVEIQSAAFESTGRDKYYYARCWFCLRRNSLFEKESLEDFQDIQALMKLISDFQKEVMSA